MGDPTSTLDQLSAVDLGTIDTTSFLQWGSSILKSRYLSNRRKLQLDLLLGKYLGVVFERRGELYDALEIAPGGDRYETLLSKMKLPSKKTAEGLREFYGAFGVSGLHAITYTEAPASEWMPYVKWVHRAIMGSPISHTFFVKDPPAAADILPYRQHVVRQLELEVVELDYRNVDLDELGVSFFSPCSSFFSFFAFFLLA